MLVAYYVQSDRFNQTFFYFLERNSTYTYNFDFILLTCIKEYDLRAQTDFETDSSEPNLQGS